MKIKVTLSIIIFLNSITCLNANTVDMNTSQYTKKIVGQNEYDKYKENFLSKDYKNITVRYFEDSYMEKPKSSFAKILPDTELTLEELKKRIFYFKVIYSNNKMVKGIYINNNKPSTEIYFDELGRKIQKYWHTTNDFEIIKLDANQSVEYIYCEAETKICTHTFKTKDQDLEAYKEKVPIIIIGE